MTRLLRLALINIFYLDMLVIIVRFNDALDVTG